MNVVLLSIKGSVDCNPNSGIVPFRGKMGSGLHDPLVILRLEIDTCSCISGTMKVLSLYFKN